MSTTITHSTQHDPIVAPQLAALLPIQRHSIAGEPAVLVSELYHALDIRKDFTTWARTQFRRAMLVEGIDFELLPQAGEHSGRGHGAIDWVITTDAAKNVALLSATPRGAAVRRYFINVEHELRRRTLAEYVKATEALNNLLRARRAIEADGSQAGRVLGGLRRERAANDQAQQFQLDLLTGILPGLGVSE